MAQITRIHAQPDRPGQKIRLLLIEDNRILRDGLSAAIRNQPDVEIVGLWGNSGKEIVRARRLKPHVVLMNMSLGRHDSVELAGTLTREVPEARVVVMDLLPSQESVLEFVQAGASGFILKDATVEEFLQTIRLVARKHKVLPPPLAGPLFSQIIEGAGRRKKSAVKEPECLTRREQEVVDLIAEGFSNKEIAGQLYVTVYTVKSHVHKILEKLGLRTRLEIANYAHSRGNHNSVATFLAD